MAPRAIFILQIILAIALSTPSAWAEEQSILSYGGDLFAAGQASEVTAPVSGDAFIAGADATMSQAVGGSAHLAGFSVNADGATGHDLYAAGFSVSVAAPVTGNVTAVGNSVALRSSASVGRNARLAGASVVVAGPIQGSALISAKSLTLEAPVSGDLNFFGEGITFGSGARVDGKVTIHAPEDITVPASVASADRVSFTLMERGSPGEAGEAVDRVVRGFWPALWTFAIWWLLLFVVGVALISLQPGWFDTQQAHARGHAVATFGYGLLGLATLFGLVPLVAITLVGLLLLPAVFLLIFLLVSLGYLGGVYLIGLRIAAGFTQIEDNRGRVLVLAVSLLVAALIGFIPVLGWLITMVIGIFGLGAIVRGLFQRRPGAAPMAPAAPGV